MLCNYGFSQQVLPLVEVEMEAGDALFFHSNVLHRSDKNDSDRRRWAFLIAYNRTSNNPVYPHHHPQCTKLEKVKFREWIIFSVLGIIAELLASPQGPNFSLDVQCASWETDRACRHS